MRELAAQGGYAAAATVKQYIVANMFSITSIRRHNTGTAYSHIHRFESQEATNILETHIHDYKNQMRDILAAEDYAAAAKLNKNMKALPSKIMMQQTLSKDQEANRMAEKRRRAQLRQMHELAEQGSYQAAAILKQDILTNTPSAAGLDQHSIGQPTLPLDSSVLLECGNDTGHEHSIFEKTEMGSLG